MENISRRVPPGLARRCAPVVGVALAMVAGLPAGASAELPDGRNYELVSPADTGVNAAVPLPTRTGITQASADGRRVIYPNAVPLPGAEHGVLTSYLAERGAGGWTTASASPKPPQAAVDGSGLLPAFLYGPTVVGIDPDVTAPIVQSGALLGTDYLRPGLIFFSADLYFRRGDQLSWVSRPTVEPAASPDRSTFDAANSSGSQTHILFKSSEAKDPDHPAVNLGLYRWSEGDEHATLVGIDENDAPLDDARGGGGPEYTGYTRTNTISPDGSRIIFNAITSGGSVKNLYVRVGDETINIASAPNGQGPLFEGATPDLSRVFFSYADVIPGSGAPAGGGLYAYDVPASGDPADGSYEFLTTYGDIVPDDVKTGMVAIAPDGGHVYYVEETAGVFELRVLDVDGGTSQPIATLDPNDGPVDALALPTWGNAKDTKRQARVTADGEYLLFASKANGIGTGTYDTGGFTQLFRYKLGSAGGPVCVSCAPGGAASTAASVVSFFGTEELPGQVPYTATRNLSADGKRVFFVTKQKLVAEDVNTKVDVYQWSDGTVHLISGGKGDADSYFIDASASGDDVFFTSFEELVPEQTDGTQAVYDARVGAPKPVWPEDNRCSGDACQPPAGPAPGVPAAGSNAPGTGNVVTPPDPPNKDDSEQPKVTKLTSSKLSSLARTGRTSITVTASQAGKVTVTITGKVRGKTRTLAKGTKTAKSAGQKVAVTVKLSTTARRELRRTKRLPLRIVASDPGGKSAASTATLRVAKASKKNGGSR